MANRVVLNHAEVRRQGNGHATRLVRRTCDDIRDSAKRRVQVKTGKTRSSLNTRIRTTAFHVTGTVEATTRQAEILHGGARRHPIPNLPWGKGKRLAFHWKRIGKHVILAGVNHPGMKGTRYLTIPLMAYGSARGFRVGVIRRSSTG